MAAVSCKYMLWQHARTQSRTTEERALAMELDIELGKLQREFANYWPRRNKSPLDKCAAFLRWRQTELRAS
jgi:hypothetical protein